MPFSRQHAMLVTLALGIATQAGLAGVLTALASITLSSSSIWSPAVAACVLDFIVLVTTPAAALFTTRSTTYTGSRKPAALLIVFSLAVFLAAIVLSIYTLAYTWTNLPSHLSTPSTRLTIAGLALWSATTLLQPATHIALLLTLINRHASPNSPHNSPTSSLPPPHQPIQPETTQRPALPRPLLLPSLPTTPTTHAPTLRSPSSAAPSSARSSIFRTSLHQAIRPITSRTKLLRSPASSSHPAPKETGAGAGAGRLADYSLDFGCRGAAEGFEGWDTSAVEGTGGVGEMVGFANPNPFATSAVSSPATAHFTHESGLGPLDAIPGSRPTSSVQLGGVDGAFPRPSTATMRSGLSTNFDFGSDREALPSPRFAVEAQMMGRNGSADGESHIHPLFRSQSPGSPPNVSPATVVEMGEAERGRSDSAARSRSRLGSG